MLKGLKKNHFFANFFYQLQRHLNIVWYRTYAQLKSESRQHYLGFAWFLMEPVLMTTILYWVFGVFLNNRGPEFVLFILIGMTIWQWFEAGVTEGMMGIKAKLHIMNQIALPKYIFPWVHVLTVTIRFLFVFVIILGFSWGLGHKVTLAYVGLIPLIFSQLLLIAGIASVLAVCVAYCGDLTKLVALCMRLLFYVSGIFFSADVVPETLRFYFDLNPLARLMEGYRGVLIEGVLPSAGTLLYVIAIAIISNIIGLSVCYYFNKKLLKAVTV